MSIEPICTHPVDDFMPCRVCIPPTPPMTDDQFRGAVAELLEHIDLTDPAIDLTSDVELEERASP